jgi:hypothetical protein
MVPEHNRVASSGIRDGTLTGSGRQWDLSAIDFFRVEDGATEQHWESVGWISAYQSFGLLREEAKDA